MKLQMAAADLVLQAELLQTVFIQLESTLILPEPLTKDHLYNCCRFLNPEMNDIT